MIRILNYIKWYAVLFYSSNHKAGVCYWVEMPVVVTADLLINNSVSPAALINNKRQVQYLRWSVSGRFLWLRIRQTSCQSSTRPLKVPPTCHSLNVACVKVSVLQKDRKCTFLSKYNYLSFASTLKGEVNGIIYYKKTRITILRH